MLVGEIEGAKMTERETDTRREKKSLRGAARVYMCVREIHVKHKVQ